MMNCYASHNYRDFSHAGNISKNFNEHIMQDMGFKNVALRQTHFHNKILGFASYRSVYTKATALCCNIP